LKFYIFFGVFELFENRCHMMQDYHMWEVHEVDRWGV